MMASTVVPEKTDPVENVEVCENPEAIEVLIIDTSKVIRDIQGIDSPPKADPVENVAIFENPEAIEVLVVDTSKVIRNIQGIESSPKADPIESAELSVENDSTQNDQLCVDDLLSLPCQDAAGKPCQDAAGVESSKPCQDAAGVESSKPCQDAAGVESGKSCQEVDRKEGIKSSPKSNGIECSELQLSAVVANRESSYGKVTINGLPREISEPITEHKHFFDNCYTACIMTIDHFSLQKTKKEQITSSEFKFASNTWRMQAEFRESLYRDENEEALIVSLMRVTERKIDAEIKVRSSLIDKNGSKQRIVCDDLASSLIPLSDMATSDMSSFTRKSSDMSFSRRGSFMGLLVITNSVLLDKFHEDLLPNDRLVICVELFMEDSFPYNITWNNGPETLPLASQPYMTTLSSNLSTLLETGEYADIILKAGDMEIPAHKLILSSRSKTFAKKLDENRDEKYLTIEDVELDIVMPLLKYIYSSVVPDLSVESVCSLYASADVYALPELKGWCKQQLAAKLSEENVYCILLFVDEFKDCELKNLIIEYFLFNINLFLKKNWRSFCEEYPDLSIEILNEFTAKSVTSRLLKCEACPFAKSKDEKPSESL